MKPSAPERGAIPVPGPGARTKVRVLIVEDSPTDAELNVRELRKGQFEPEWTRVDTEADFLAALDAQPEVILCDYSMPNFDGLRALELLRERSVKTPFILISGTLGEERAVEAIKGGADDYLLKDRLGRLGEAVRRAFEMRDIREARAQAEEALRESERAYRQLVHGLPVAVYTTDAEGGIELFNEAAVALWGRRPRPHEDRWCCSEKLFTPDGTPIPVEQWPLALAIRENRQVLGEEVILEQPDGNRYWVVQHPCPMHDADGRVNGAVNVLMDITKRKEAEEQLRIASRALESDLTETRNLEAQLLQAQKMESVGRLAGGIAHDFNNLLGVILGYGGLLLAKIESGPDRTKLEQIVKAGERAAGLTRQLLAFSRKQVLQPRVLDLNDLVADMEKMLRRLIGEDIELATLLEGVGNVKADPGQIEQVLMNLVVNARDAMPQGGLLTVRTSNVVLDDDDASEHADVRPGPFVTLSVIDTGVGMTPETQRKIFEPFFTTKGTSEGTGLGLATSDGIVRQSGGHMVVTSELGRGSTFMVYLPRVGEEVLSAVAAPTLRPPLGTETILLAEDEPGLREITREILEEHGYVVIEAGSGDGALKCAAEFPGDIGLLLTDVVMPRMGGRELAERLTVLRPRLRVMFMSGYTDDAVVRHGVLSTSAAFIQKPFGSETLLAKIREVLEQSFERA